MTEHEANGSPRILARADHPVSRKQIHTNALKVLYRLDRAGHKGYLVGGAVRDLLLGREPKDYDIATDARPQQIRRLFRNSRIIGRRFRLAHVYFKEGIIEVATFRRDPDPASQDSRRGERLITDDNVFGTPREDAFRRDFTVNALFYDIGDFTVIDYVGGIDDLRAGVIDTIGDPAVRFQEDPVRMMRACEMAGRLGFTITSRTQEALHEQRREIDKAAPARLTEEVTQLLRCGHATPALQWMLELGLLDVVLPELTAAVAAAERGLPHAGLLVGLDGVVADGRKLSDTALFGVLLLPLVVLDRLEREEKLGRPLGEADKRRLVADRVGPFTARLRISKLRGERLVDTLLAVERLGEGEWRLQDRVRFAQRAIFDDALALFELLCLTTGGGREQLEAWRDVAKQRRRRGSGKRGSRRRPRRRRRRRKRR